MIIVAKIVINEFITIIKICLKLKPHEPQVILGGTLAKNSQCARSAIDLVVMNVQLKKW